MPDIGHETHRHRSIKTCVVDIVLELKVHASSMRSSIRERYIRLGNSCGRTWSSRFPFPVRGPGLEGLKDILHSLRTAFPDIDFSIKEQISEGDKVASRFEWTGTHRAPFMGIPATGQQVRVWGIVIDRLEAGRIKDTRILMDTLGMLAQLGALPPPAG